MFIYILITYYSLFAWFCHLRGEPRSGSIMYKNCYITALLWFDSFSKPQSLNRWIHCYVYHPNSFNCQFEALPQMADRAKSELGWCQPSIDQTEVFWKIKFQQRINKATKDMINIDHTCIMEMEWDTCSFWRPGLEKTGKTGSSLQGNFVIWRKKNREIHKGNPPTLEGNLPCWKQIFAQLAGK